MSTFASIFLRKKIKPNMYAQKSFARNLRTKAARKILVKLTQGCLVDGSMLALIVTKKTKFLQRTKNQIEIFPCKKT